MTLQKLLKIIKKYNYWSEEAPAAYQFVAYPLNCYIEQAKYFHPQYLSVGIWIFKDDFFYEETPREEKYEIYKYIFKKVKKDKRYLIKQKIASDKNLKFLTIGKKFLKNKNKLSNIEIWKSYERFMMKYYIEWLRRGPATIECADVFGEEYLPGLIKRELKKEDNLDEIMTILTAFSGLSFMEKERILFLKAALAAKRKSKSFNSLVKKLTSDFFWTRNTFTHIKVLKEKDYIKEIKKEISKKSIQQIREELLRLKSKVRRLKTAKTGLYRKYNFSKELKLHFYILEQMGGWIDYRKEHMLQANYYINLYCEELAKRFKEDLWKIYYYLPWEFKNLLLFNKRVSINVLKNRRQFSVYAVEKEKPNGWRAQYTIFYKKDAKKIFDGIFPKNKNKEIKGQVANAPVSKMRGKVQVILNTYNQKFISGRILVTSMTRPDFVPIMRQAKAIITDEGGLTCHAAIISRELGIPCIIGTKIATKVLKDGDLVEVDANKGVIKKINK
jgi:phosphohistidine swiveling domain-containing protein